MANRTITILGKGKPIRPESDRGCCARRMSRPLLIATGSEHPVRNPPIPPQRRPPALPVLTADAEPTPEDERLFAAVARQAAAGDAVGRNLLWFALEAKIDRFVRRCRPDIHEGNSIWERDDIAQEAFVVFVELVESWSGRDDFLRYFLSYFPWRLRDQVRSWERRPLASAQVGATGLTLAEDGSASAELARIELERLAASMSALDGQIVRLHVLHNESLASIARQLGLDRRTVSRHWGRIVDRLRRTLTDEDMPPYTPPRDPRPRIAAHWLEPWRD